MSALQEATGDSEYSHPAADGSSIDADEGDAGSCCGEDASDSTEEMQGGAFQVQYERRIVSWGCWVVESASTARHMVAVGGAGEGACPSTEVAAEECADSDRLFWEACIAHGY